MRELTDGERDACRKRAYDKVKKHVMVLPQNIVDEDKMENLQGLFHRQIRCMKKISNNFDAKKFFERKHDVNTPGEDLRCMIKGHLTAVFTFEAIAEEMKKNPLAHVNGTSLKFQKYAAFAQKQMIRFERAKEMFETNGEACKPEQKTLSPAVLKARIYEIIAGLLFVPDLLTV